MQNKASYLFHNELNDFLSKKDKNKKLEHAFYNSPIVKDSIESLGVPHPEVAHIKANGNFVTFDYRVNNDDNIEVFPYFCILDVESIVPIKPAEIKFMLDVHLGGLAKYLRMAGIDTLYNNEDWGDKYIAETGGKENRIVLSRDIGLLKRSSVTYGYFVRNKDSYEQFKEISERYKLKEVFKPFSRCIRCNGEIAAVEKSKIIGQLEEGTKRDYDEFWQCKSCQQVYWKGSHYEKMEALFDS